MSKKCTCIILTLSIITFLTTGCGKVNTSPDYSIPPVSTEKVNDNQSVDDSSVDQNDVSSTNNPDITNDNLITIGFAQVGHESDWRMAATESAQEVFSEAEGYDLHFVDAHNNMKTQLQAVNEFIKQKVDYIVIDPIVTTGWDKVMKSAKEAKIPVFLIDRTIDCDPEMYEAWFGSDFNAEGEAAGAWLEAYLKDKGREKETITIVTIAGTEGSTAQIGRTNGFEKYIKNNSNWKKLAEEDGKFTQTDGKTVMEAFLEDYRDIDVVVCQNDDEARGAMAALSENGITYGVGGEVIIISFDATHDGLTSVLAGKVNANFECNPLSAPYVGDAIQLLESGKTINNKINYIHELCFQAEDNITSISYAGRTSDMVTVSEDILKSRAY